MECDNNNDIDISSVKALDNKLCSEACFPGEWQSAEHELWFGGGGDGISTLPISHSPLLSRRNGRVCVARQLGAADHLETG